MAREDPHFRLRVPPGLRERIADEAKRNNRSMNAEIVARLEKSFTESPISKEAREWVQEMIEVTMKSLVIKANSIERRTRLGLAHTLRKRGYDDAFIDALIADIDAVPDTLPENRHGEEP